MFKKVLIRIKSIIKLIVLLGISSCIILGGVSFFYNPIYSVSVNGEFIGYTENKSNLQKRINDYTQNGNGENSNIAFVQIDQMPEYKLCLLKNNIVTNDDEIFEKIIGTGTTYYRYYSIAVKEEEKLYVSDIETAEGVIQSLKDKNSNNIDKLMILEKYETELKDFTSKEDAIEKLYEKKIVTPTYVAKKSAGSVNTASNRGQGAPNIGITLSKPISGTISSRFGEVSRIRSSAHSGLDIAAPMGTPIGAAADGTISFVGYKGTYGNLIVVDHGNGVQTYYAHCSSICVEYGQSVTRGQTIGKVGSTGNSTGPHLHLEVRLNGVAYNPQNYVYN